MDKRIIKCSSVLGYCMGVRRAVEATIKATKDYPNSNIYTFGELIHNPVTLKMLEKLKVKIIDEDDLLNDKIKKNDIVVIRAHGITPKILSKLKEREVILIDCTCPRVVSNRCLAQKQSEVSTIILVGDKNHPELISIQGYVLENKNTNCIIIQNEEEAKEIKILKENENFSLIAQTTIKEKELLIIQSILQKKIKNLKVFNTICSATFERQKALKKLIGEVEAIVIIGGKNSANTKRLYISAKESGKPTFFIEKSSELTKEIYSYKTIGLASGASTPDETINEVYNLLNT